MVLHIYSLSGNELLRTWAIRDSHGDHGGYHGLRRLDAAVRRILLALQIPVLSLGSLWCALRHRNWCLAVATRREVSGMDPAIRVSGIAPQWIRRFLGDPLYALRRIDQMGKWPSLVTYASIARPPMVSSHA